MHRSLDGNLTSGAFQRIEIAVIISAADTSSPSRHVISAGDVSSQQQTCGARAGTVCTKETSRPLLAATATHRACRPAHRPAAAPHCGHLEQRLRPITIGVGGLYSGGPARDALPAATYRAARRSAARVVRPSGKFETRDRRGALKTTSFPARLENVVSRLFLVAFFRSAFIMLCNAVRCRRQSRGTLPMSELFSPVLFLSVCGVRGLSGASPLALSEQMVRRVDALRTFQSARKSGDEVRSCFSHATLSEVPRARPSLLPLAVLSRFSLCLCVASR
mmetsp:Transcript_20120/g.33755  ORF Transcript_20120/g.33755 Transcript_20120/m.33755 type:complete len:277 (+) Transcript_20120:249-1079(+)